MIDRCFITRLVESADIKIFVETKSVVKPEMVKEPEKSVYKFCIEYFDKHRKIPTFSLIEENFRESFKAPCDAELSYYIDEIINREAYNQVSRKINEIYPLMDRGRGVEALEKLDLGIKAIYKNLSSPDEIKSLFGYGEEVLEMYEKAKKGMVGVSTGIESLDEITMGWQPEDVAIFVARSGVGKSWLLILLARHAWSEAKKKVLFVSPEIANARVLFRFLSKHLKMDYEIMRKGRLGSIAEAKLSSAIKDLISGDDGRFKIVGSDFGADLQSIEKAIIISEPDIVFIDGIYLLERKRSWGTDKHERIANVVDEIKGLAKKYSVPVIGASQLNRKASGRREIKDDMLSFSDAILMDADYLFAMVQDIDMRADKIMKIQPMKIREGDLTRQITLRWDFVESDFSEIVERRDEGVVPF